MRFLYIYETPESRKQGLIKIGDAIDVEKRIAEQFKSASVIDASAMQYTILYQTEALRKDGTAFRDHDIHAALIAKGYGRHQIQDKHDTLKTHTEWFNIDYKKVVHLVGQFKKGKDIEFIDIDRFESFSMRPEQKLAVEQTLQYFEQRGTDEREPTEMLWNAKMRFGKTFTAYQLVRRMQLKKVLVITYKPAVEDAWQTDLESHVDFTQYVFLRRDSLSMIDYYLSHEKGVVAFASYQDLLGSHSDGSAVKEKHKQLFSTQWDIVIIDEFHYGTSTARAKELLTEEVEAEQGSKKDLEQRTKELYADEDETETDEQESEDVAQLVSKEIHSAYRLYLSGTPFKAISDGRFSPDAIFNWTYTDEQRAKEQWPTKYPDLANENPYQSLPQILMYLYKVSDDLIAAGVAQDKDEFSLNHFFRANKSKKFIQEEAIQGWLNLISGITRPAVSMEDELSGNVSREPSQYPFDHESALFNELDHTLWYLNRVDSAIALKRLLEQHPVFMHFHIILAAGSRFGSGVEAVSTVRQAIASHPKTITLSVGKLTTGVTIPQWKGVLFLRDIASPENYFQTAFRAQSPFTHPKTGKRKEQCFIFDFSPNRSLRLLTTYSEKLSSDRHLTSSERKIAEFIRYLPVLKMSGNQMQSMDAREVLTFDLSNVDAKSLGNRFIERRNVVVTSDTLAAINASEQSAQRCQSIFERIKQFRKASGISKKEERDIDANVIDLDVNEKRIRDLQTKEPTTPRQEQTRDKELEQAQKAQQNEREKVRELLKTLLARIPLFMYLTDATEENLEQVLIETEDDLFRKATGITVSDFRFLVEAGLLRVDSLDGYILRFIQLENQNFELVNEMRSEPTLNE